MKWPHLMLLCLVLAGCKTSYKVAPSTEKVATKIASAQRSVEHSRSVAKQIETTTLVTITNATTTEGHIVASLEAVAKHDYVTAAQELILAKASNALVQEMLRESLRNVGSLQDSLDVMGRDLIEAQGELDTLTTKFAKVVEDGAKAQAIVDEVNWGFRVGALFYFVKGILAMGFWGILIIGVLLIAFTAIGGPMAGIARWFGGAILGLLRKR